MRLVRVAALAALAGAGTLAVAATGSDCGTDCGGDVAGACTIGGNEATGGIAAGLGAAPPISPTCFSAMSKIEIPASKPPKLSAIPAGVRHQGPLGAAEAARTAGT